MSLVHANRVREGATASGTTNLQLLGAETGFRTFSSAVATGRKVAYVVLDGNNAAWEVGYGTLVSASELSRDTVVDSSATSGRVNNEEPGTPIKISLSTNQHTVFLAPNAQGTLTTDEDGELADPSPFRAALFVDTWADMTAETGLTDGETFFVRGGASINDGKGGLFYWDDSDAGAEDGYDSHAHDTISGGLFKRIRQDIQGVFFGGTAEIDAATADATGGKVRIRARKKATDANAYVDILTDYASNALRVAFRWGQASLVNFLSFVSRGDTRDLIEAHVPVVLASRTNSNDLAARGLAWLSGVSRLALSVATPSSGAAANYWEMPLTKGGYVLGVFVSPTALAAVDAAVYAYDGQPALVTGTTADGDQPPFWVRWSAASSATDNGYSVIRPSTGAASSGNGRWLRVAANPTRTFANADATPSIANGSFFVTAGTPPAAITDFDDSHEGQWFVVAYGGANQVITHNASFIDLGGADVTISATNPRLLFKHVNGVHVLVSASASGANFASVLTPSTISSNQNDYAPTGHAAAQVFRLATDAARSLTGLAGGAAGRVVVLQNVGSNDLLLKDDSGSSTAGNRFVLSGGDVLIPAEGSYALWYDSTTSRWRPFNDPSSPHIKTGTVMRTADYEGGGFAALHLHKTLLISSTYGKGATASDAYDSAFLRKADYTGGVPYNTNVALKVGTAANNGTVAFEWNFLCLLENYANFVAPGGEGGPGGPQNCALVAYAHKYGTSNTFGANIACIDHITNPATSSVAMELDIVGIGNDDNNARVGLHLVAGTIDEDVAGSKVGTAILISAANTCDIKKGIVFDGDFDTYLMQHLTNGYSVSGVGEINGNGVNSFGHFTINRSSGAADTTAGFRLGIDGTPYGLIKLLNTLKWESNLDFIAPKFGAGISPSVRLHVLESANATVAAIGAGNTSQSADIFQLTCGTAAGSGWLFMRAQSSGGDTEFYIRGDGEVRADGSFTGGGADRAELLERRPEHAGEDWAGRGVVVEDGFVRLARADETPQGVVTYTYDSLGNAAPMGWSGRYLTDAFGRTLTEAYALVEWSEEVPDGPALKRDVTEDYEEEWFDDQVVDGAVVRVTRTRTAQRPVFDVLPLIDEAGEPVMEMKPRARMATVTDEQPEEILDANGDPVLDDRGRKTYRVIRTEKQVQTHELVLTPAVRRIVRTESFQPMKREDRSYHQDRVPEGVVVPDDATIRTVDGSGAPLTRFVVNPAYNPDVAYTPRVDRPEWVPVCGFMGLIRWAKDNASAPPSDWVKWRDFNGDVEEWLVR